MFKLDCCIKLNVIRELIRNKKKICCRKKSASFHTTWLYQAHTTYKRTSVCRLYSFDVILILVDQVKKSSAESEKAWKGCGQKVGIKIWRIVKFKVEDWPLEDYGYFFDGDSYIILHTYKKDPSSEVQKYWTIKCVNIQLHFIGHKQRTKRVQISHHICSPGTG